MKIGPKWYLVLYAFLDSRCIGQLPQTSITSPPWWTIPPRQIFPSVSCFGLIFCSNNKTSSQRTALFITAQTCNQQRCPLAKQKKMVVEARSSNVFSEKNNWGIEVQRETLCLWCWGVKSGPCTGQAGALPLGQIPSSMEELQITLLNERTQLKSCILCEPN